jgi:hypothetical protein
MDKPIRDIPKEKRKSYISKKKGWERLKIRELLAEGKTYADIQAALSNVMSPSTFWNRLNEIRMEDNAIIKKKLDENNTFLVTDLSTLDRQLGQALEFCKQLIEDEKASWFLKLEAKKFAVDVAVWRFKLQVEGPRIITEATTPVRKVATGELRPIDAIQQNLPRLKSATNEEREKFKNKWVEQVQGVEVTTIEDSQEEKGQDSA